VHPKKMEFCSFKSQMIFRVACRSYGGVRKEEKRGEKRRKEEKRGEKRRKKRRKEEKR